MITTRSAIIFQKFQERKNAVLGSKRNKTHCHPRGGERHAPRMTAQDHYLKSCDDYRKAHAAVADYAEQLRGSNTAIEQEIGEALHKHPERIKFVGLPEGSGITFQAHFSPAYICDVKKCPDAHLIADAIVTQAEARIRCEAAYERLSFSERSGMCRPSELIPSVL